MMWQVLDATSTSNRQLAGTQFGKVAAFAQQLNIIHHFSVDGREIMALALDTEVRDKG